MYIFFITLNKWLKANQLSLNFNKTNYVHFTTNRNMSVNLEIGSNNNFITNSPYTKFLGLTINNTLSWNNHIDLIMKNLSKACYIIINAKTYMSVSSLKVIYNVIFNSVMSYGALCYKSEGRWLDPSWCHWIFHWHKILPIALWPWGRLSL